MRTMQHDAYKALTKEEQSEFFEKACEKKYSISSTKFPVCTKPDWIPGLYCSIAFPKFDFSEREDPSDVFSISVEPADIFAGSLTYVKPDVSMTWKGYASQVYDGQLKLGSMGEGSSIVGRIGPATFEFRGPKLLRGPWPGFLVICASDAEHKAS